MCPPLDKGFSTATSFTVFPPAFTCRGHGSCFPSHANEAMGFSRKGMWTHIPVPALTTVDHAVQSSFFVSMVIHDTSHKPTLPQQLSRRSSADVQRLFSRTRETTLNISSDLTQSPCRSTAILPIVEIESLNTSVRVCFAQPSHSGAECDPRHRGAVFCIGNQPPQRSTSTGPSPEVLATPIESTDALAAGPKHGSFLFHQLSDQSCMLFSTCCIFRSVP